MKVRNQPTLRRMKIYYWTNIRKWNYFNTSFIEIRSSGEEMWRVDAYQIPYYSRGIEGEKRTRPRFADWTSIITIYLYNQRPLSYKYIADFHSIFSVYYNYTSVFSDLFRSILNLHRHFKYVLTKLINKSKAKQSKAKQNKCKATVK
jgi:hypothetical protein